MRFHSFGPKTRYISMKKIPFLLLFMLFFISCVPGGGSIEDMTKDLIKTPPSILSCTLDETATLTISFSETVEIKELIINDQMILKEKLGSSFSLLLPFSLSPGEKAEVKITILDINGNKERFYLTIKGKNNEIPSLIINEVSIKGTQSNPDRIELYVLKKGDTAGVTVSDDKFTFTLPSIKVKEGDLILIYWDKTTTKKNYERDRGKMTYILNAKASSTLPGPEGAIIIRKEEKGEIMDAFFYSEKGEEALKEGEKHKLFSEANDNGEWEGEAFDSSLVTSSRVIARLPGAIDTDTSEDFFITAPRRSTFGEENEYAPYQGT